MKKILMNAAVATGLALFAGNAFAAGDFASIGFDGTPTGQLILGADDAGGEGNSFWVQGGDSESTVVKAYEQGDTLPTNRPDEFSEGGNTKYLKIDSPSGFGRYISTQSNTQSLDEPVYIDMDVQFTVSDAVLDLGENNTDKLAIWLYAPDTDGAETNLVITAGVLSESLEPTVTNFVVDDEDLAVEPDTWYRLTVKTTLGEDGVPRFKVYVNGNLLSATGTLASDGKITTTSAVDTFASLVKFDVAGASTLSSVTFQGVGALDDLSFTKEGPDFTKETLPFAVGEKAYPTFAAALAEAGGNTITLCANYDLAKEHGINITSGNTTLDLANFSLTDSRKSISDDDYIVTVTVSGGALTIVGSGNIGVADGVLNDSILVQNGGTLALGATEASVPTLSAGIFVSGSYTVKVWGSEVPGEGVNVYDGGESSLPWNAPQTTPGYYVITAGGGEGYASGDGEHTFTIAADREAALATNLPAGKTLSDAVSETSSMTYAQAYALGLWSENSAEVEELEATISFDEDGNVVVSLANAPATGYLVTCKVYEKASLTADWPTEPTKTYAYGSEQAITPASATAGFYKVEVSVRNALGD